MDLPPMQDAADFLEEDIPAPHVLVEGLIHTGTKVALGGGSKAMKTWTQLLMALCVSHGIPFLGRKTIRSRVLFVNLEVPRSFFQQRIKAVAKALNIKVEQKWFLVWNLRGKAASHKELLPKIRNEIGEKFGLVIIDPIYKLYGESMDENSASNVGMLMNSIEDLSVVSNAAVSISAHFSKGNQSAKESIDRISGSGVFARDPDTLLIFTRHEEDLCFSVEATLRNFAPSDPFVVRWSYPLMILDDLLDPSRLRKKGGPTRKFTIEQVINILEIGIPLKPIELIKELGCNRRTFYYSLLPQMKLHTRIEHCADGWKIKDIPI